MMFSSALIPLSHNFLSLSLSLSLSRSPHIISDRSCMHFGSSWRAFYHLMFHTSSSKYWWSTVARTKLCMLASQWIKWIITLAPQAANQYSTRILANQCPDLVVWKACGKQVPTTAYTTFQMLRGLCTESADCRDQSQCKSTFLIIELAINCFDAMLDVGLCILDRCRIMWENRVDTTNCRSTWQAVSSAERHSDLLLAFLFDILKVIHWVAELAKPQTLWNHLLTWPLNEARIRVGWFWRHLVGIVQKRSLPLCVLQNT